jgi:peptidoglycan hydrolase-like protein with peptidoglycan-binding domain
MGFNAKIVGYQDAETMVTAMMSSENQQLLGVADFITYNKLDVPLRAHEWATFAKGYNGPKYAENRYDERLAEAYKKYSLGPLPGLVVRSAQVYLVYLGCNPGPVDGVLGNRTRSALNKFQVEHSLAVTDGVDESQLSALKREVDKLGP